MIIIIDDRIASPMNIQDKRISHAGNCWTIHQKASFLYSIERMQISNPEGKDPLLIEEYGRGTYIAKNIFPNMCIKEELKCIKAFMREGQMHFSLSLMICKSLIIFLWNMVATGSD
jgi:hypothetical protein